MSQPALALADTEFCNYKCMRSSIIFQMFVFSFPFLCEEIDAEPKYWMDGLVGHEPLCAIVLASFALPSYKKGLSSFSDAACFSTLWSIRASKILRIFFFYEMTTQKGERWVDKMNAMFFCAPFVEMHHTHFAAQVGSGVCCLVFVFTFYSVKKGSCKQCIFCFLSILLVWTGKLVVQGKKRKSSINSLAYSVA